MRSFFVKLVSKIKKYSLLLKILFISSVMFFVINQLTSILHGMTLGHLKNIIFSQGWKSILIMLIVGFIAVLPMILYDYATIKLLRLRFSAIELINNGWIINTINNLAGFGGVVGVSLRMNRYGKKAKQTGTLATITKTAIFMLSGLSLLSLIVTIYLYTVGVQSQFYQYRLWLLLGSFFAPGLYIFIKLNQKKLFKEFTNKIVFLFFLGSLGQWLGAMLIFLTIGHQILPNLNIWQVAPLFVAATLIGMLTMVPGGMGTFDVLIILGLSAFGIDKSVAVMWILFYRIFYYVLPFISGVVLFVHQTGQHVNQLLNGMPKIVINRLAHLFITVTMYFTGIMTIILSTMPNLTLISHFFNQLFPFSFDLFDQALNMMIGLVLIGLGRGVYNKVKRAYTMSMIILLFCIFNTLLARISWQFVVLYGILLFCLYIARDEFYREKFVYSWAGLLCDGLLITTIFVFYAVIGYYTNTKLASPRQFLLFPSDDVWFQGLAGLILAMLILFALYHYLTSDIQIGEKFDELRFRQITNKYAASYYQHFAYLNDYMFYYYQVNGQDEVVFMYQIRANRCMVLGNPIGNKDYYSKATEEFMNRLDLYDYQAVFYNIDQEFSLLLHDLGYQFMKISELGCHTPKQVTSSIKLVDSKFLSVAEVYENLEILEQISQNNQCDNNLTRFSSAYYKRDFVLESQVFAHYAKQQIDAYCVLAKYPHNHLALMYASASDNQALKQVVNDLLYYCDTNNLIIDLGVSPLANVGTSKYSFLEERLIRLLYLYGETTTNFEKVYTALDPYVNEWQPLYLAYPSKQNFFVIILQLATLIFKRRKNTLLLK